MREVSDWSTDYRDWGYLHILAALLERAEGVPEIVEVAAGNEKVVCEFLYDDRLHSTPDSVLIQPRRQLEYYYDEESGQI